MTLELYQFDLSHYCEKVRLILDYKGLSYHRIEVVPGIGQLELFQLSGQRQVPVLKDGHVMVADSTAIAHYLEQHYPEPSLIPTDPKQKGLCLLLEDWADNGLGLNARKALLGAISQYPDFRSALLPSGTPNFFKDLLGAVPGDFLGFLGYGLGIGPGEVKLAREALKRNLEALVLLLEHQPYVVGETLTLADLAIAGLSFYLQFPVEMDGAVPESLRGLGIPGFADDPAYRLFFEWRDRLYQQYRKPGHSPESDNGKPTTIEIE